MHRHHQFCCCSGLSCADSNYIESKRISQKGSTLRVDSIASDAKLSQAVIDLQRFGQCFDSVGIELAFASNAATVLRAQVVRVELQNLDVANNVLHGTIAAPQSQHVVRAEDVQFAAGSCIWRVVDGHERARSFVGKEDS